MKVVILCGGQGTRLREETEYRPKPLVEIGGRPILWHIMKRYAHHGYREFVLCLGYRGSMIKEYFLNYEAMNNDFTVSLGSRSALTYHDAHGEQDYKVTLAETGTDSMTGGRIKRVSRFIDEDLFMVTYGDGLSDVNITELVAFHKRHGRLATVTTVRPSSRFGVIEHDPEGLVHSFSEKPQLEGSVNAGFFVFNKRVVDYIGGDDTVLEREPLERLARDRQLVAFQHEGFFQAMDTYREFRQLNEAWAAGRAPWKIGR